MIYNAERETFVLTRNMVFNWHAYSEHEFKDKTCPFCLANMDTITNTIRAHNFKVINTNEKQIEIQTPYSSLAEDYCAESMEIVRLYALISGTKLRRRKSDQRRERQRELLHKDRLTGIYRITCIRNKRTYVGQSFDIRARLLEHQAALRKNEHSNSILQHDWNTWGESYFKSGILEICRHSKLKTKEEYWIEKLATRDPRNGYNELRGGTFDHIDYARKNGIIPNERIEMRQVEEIIKLTRLGYSRNDISKSLGISLITVKDIQCLLATRIK